MPIHDDFCFNPFFEQKQTNVTKDCSNKADTTLRMSRSESAWERMIFEIFRPVDRQWSGADFNEKWNSRAGPQILGTLEIVNTSPLFWDLL